MPPASSTAREEVTGRHELEARRDSGRKGDGDGDGEGEGEALQEEGRR